MKDTGISDIEFKNGVKKSVMKPDSTDIYFTVASGAGYGMVVVLSILLLINDLNYIFYAKIIISVLSFFLVFSGLLASTIHSVNLKRLWLELNQWRVSWPSIEILFAIITLVPLILFYFSWIILNNEILTIIFLISSASLSIITVYCTSKIYSSIKTIPIWSNPFVSTLYILNALVSGSLVLFLIFYYFKIESYFLHNFIIVIFPATLFLKILYWYSMKKQKANTVHYEIGIKNRMIDNINNSKLFSYRWCCIILTYITPVYCLLQTPSLVVNHEVSVITYSIVTILAFIGMLIERWLFFIES